MRILSRGKQPGGTGCFRGSFPPLFTPRPALISRFPHERERPQTKDWRIFNRAPIQRRCSVPEPVP
jgi:hypothetical protein